jgi:hypothetical protein
MSGRTVHLLDLSTAPTDPVERIFWLDGVLAKVEAELTEQYGEAYFQARLEGRFEAALRVGRTSRTRALKMTRQVNEASGRSVRWADGMDPTSTAYEG